MLCPFSKHKSTRPPEKDGNEMELTRRVPELTTKPSRRMICRCPTIERDYSADDDSRRVKDPGETSQQPTMPGDTSTEGAKHGSHQLGGAAASSGNDKKVRKLEESHLRFGPLYLVDQPAVDATKEKAWEHVLQKSSENGPSETKDIYVSAIRGVEKEAREIYAENISAKGSNFRWMMIKDGCFFLQLVLLVLGCHEQLGYPSSDPIFGKKHNKKDVRKWIEAMFFVGNQIPMVILKELMKQKFFQDVIAKRKWDPPPSDLCRRVFFELFVLPVHKRSNHGLSISLKDKLFGRGCDLAYQHQPSDLIHGLQKLVIGPGPPGYPSDEYEADDDIDLEANEDEITDYGRILPGAVEDDSERAAPGEIGHSLRLILNAVGSAIEDRKRIFPCAMELKQAGIRIKKLNCGGARSIHFKSFYLSAYLYLPVLHVDNNTELLFRNLKTYEVSQQYGRRRREVSSYLRVMSDIIQTPRDVKLLEKEGIIQGHSDHAEKLPRILSRLSSEDIRLTHEFHVLRSQIRDYSSPLIHYKKIINIVVFLALLQTFFTLLAYFRPPKS